MVRFKKMLAIIASLMGIGVVVAMGGRPINPDYDANRSILQQRLDPFSRNQVTINMVRNTLQRLDPQNLNNNINGGSDLFNLGSNMGSNNQQLNFGFNRCAQLQSIIENVIDMCEQGNNRLVWQAVYGRATQLIHALQNGALGNNPDENFERLEYELHSLVNISQVVAYNYLYPQDDE